MRERFAPLRARTIAAWVAVAVPLGAGQPVTAQQASGLDITTVRFFRAPGPETLIEVFCRIPLAELAPLPGGAVRAAYRIAVSVRDSGDLELLSRSWSRVVEAKLLDIDGAASAEHFVFAAKPGRYAIDVAVTDSGSGRGLRERAEVNAYAARPVASDLLVAGGVRVAEAGDTIPRAGELRKGSVFVQTSGFGVTTPDHAQLGYYLELYAQRPETAAVVARVVAGSGREFATAEPQHIALPAGGGAATAMFDLSGLPPGEYRLALNVETPDSQVERHAWFAMTGFGRPRDAPPASAVGVESDTLARLQEGQLDSLYAPLDYLLEPDERGVYAGLTADGKRSFLRRFWKKRDPTPGTARNEAAERFYTVVAEANSQFREGGAAAVPGWRTDRGRIYIRYGPPDEVLDRGQAGSTRPYVVWKYTSRKHQRYVFFDVTRMGNYELIWTDERHELSRPDWQALLGPEAVQDILRF